MPEQSYPISCKSCGKQLYGPASYCPYCAVPCAVAPIIEAAVILATIEPLTEDIVVTPQPVSVSVQQPPPIHAEAPPGSPPEEIQEVTPEVKPPEQKSKQSPEITAENLKDESTPPVITHLKSSGNLKWVAIAVVLVVSIAGYLTFHKKGGSSQESPGSQQASSPTVSGQGNKDSARIVAQDTLRLGTGLSLTISKLPKLDKVLKAAKQLGDISPRYQEQIASAESMVSSARTDRDKSLMAYIGKVVELSSYQPDQVNYAMGVIQSGDITPREKIVVELLTKHVNSSRNSSKADAKKVLSDFTQQFSDFVD